MSTPFIDIHTHHPVISKEIVSVGSIFLQEIEPFSKLNTPFSAAIHPWHADQFDSGQVSNMLKNLINQPELIAVGETGLDKACSTNYQHQKELFELHLHFAEKYHKPLILHTVKSWNELQGYLKRSKLTCILHGYAEGIALTRQLIDLGCYFSLGKSLLNITPRIREAIQIIPVTSMFLETDDSRESIINLYRELSETINIPIDILKNLIYNNFVELSKFKP